MPVTSRRDKVLYKGTETFTLIQANKTITFPAPMPSADYDLYWATPAISVNVSITNKTANGFTIQLGIALAMEMTWVAVEKLTP